MLTTSQHIATSSSSRICDKMALARSSFTESAFPRADGVAIAASQTKIIRIRAKLFATGCGNKKIVFQPQASATFPVHAGLNGKHHARTHGDRKSTRLNSSHTVISYAVFCLKKKKLLLTILT